MTTPVKKCRKCDVELVVGDNWSPSFAQQGTRTCRTCVSTYNKAWYAANRARAYANKQAWRAVNKGRESANKKAWYEANKARPRANNKAWYEANVEKAHAVAAVHRAVRCGATLPPGQAIADAAEACSHIYTEARRLTTETGLAHHVDHIVPCADGGLHAPENLQVVPAYINIRKHAQDNDAFLARFFAGEVSLADDLPDEHANLIIDHLEAEARARGETLDIEALLAPASLEEK